MAFLLAVNWRIHITDVVFQRWTEIVLKYTPSLPPSPDSSCPLAASQSAEWKSIILRLNPELDNIELSISTTAQATVKSISSACPRASAPLVADRSAFGYGSNETTPTPKYYTPNILEPSPTSAYPTGRPAPALGLLPTPRLTPQTGFSTPAVSAASYMLKSSSSSMCLAMAQASSATASQFTDRWQTSSPLSYVSHRRSSLANSVSSMSSPESMVSDSSSRSSRSSSISSASGPMSAPISSKLDVQARCRYAKLCSERNNRSTHIATVPEGFCDNGPTSSPESYAGPVGKDFLDLTLNTPLARREVEMEYLSKDEEAARALQELHNCPRSAESPNKGAKRSRPLSIDQSSCLQENVRDMLNGHYQSESSWSDTLVRSRVSPSQVAIRSTSERKRVCCATEARDVPTPSLHPAFGGIGGPGMWAGILN